MQTHTILSQPLRAGRATGLDHSPTSCAACGVRRHCLPMGLSEADIAGIDQLVERRLLLGRGEHLYQLNEPSNDRLYAIRSGQFKTYVLSPEGEQRVTGFHMSGEFLGLDTIGLAHHRGSALALTPAEVCEFSYHRLAEAAGRQEGLSQLFQNLMGKELARQQDATLLLRNGHADQKFASFLLRMAHCYGARGGANYMFLLPMSRQEIGDYLGLTAATISRLICNFKHMACLKAVRRNIIILDAGMLTAIATGTQQCQRGAAPAPQRRTA